MSTLDAGFFFVEHQNVPMHIGSLMIFEGPAPSYQDITSLYTAKLPRVPRYRQVVRTAPLLAFRPVWMDDPHFEIGYHIRHTAVPSPGGPAQVRKLASRVFAQRLDRARPLWEAWLVEGLKGGRWAIITKVHHCMVDGVGGTDLISELFDIGPDAGPPLPVAWHPEPQPGTGRLLLGSLYDTLAWPLRQLAGGPAFVRQRLPGCQELVRYAAGLGQAVRRLAVPSASSLNGPIGPHRRWDWATVRLGTVREIRGGLGGTVNDVLLAAITRGFRDLLAARGELRDGLIVRSLVPVSVRSQDDRAAVGNRISAVLANLPAGEPDPVRRLALLRDQMNDLKSTRQAVGAEILTEMLGVAAPTMLALGSRAAFRIPQPLVQTVTTNVPGPPFPLFILGRTMVSLYPYVPIGDNERISVAVFSYLDRFYFGITADYDAVPDLGVLTRGIRRGLDELREHSAAAGSDDRAQQGAAASRKG